MPTKANHKHLHISPANRSQSTMKIICKDCKVFCSAENHELATADNHLLSTATATTENGCPSKRDVTSSCWICLGIKSESFRRRLQEAITTAAEPYNTTASVHSQTRWSARVDPPRLILPGDCVYRCFLANDSQQKKDGAQKIAKEYGMDLKRFASELIKESIPLATATSFTTRETNSSNFNDKDELGYLTVQVTVVPAAGVVIRPLHLIPAVKKVRLGRKARFRDDSQGGDPRANLNNRLAKEGTQVWTLNQALDTTFRRDSSDEKMQNQDLPAIAVNIHVAVWRRPFYIKGFYTKNRRDVSQTPFFVNEGGKRRKLGITSVEEQITPVISKFCGGISNHNNDPGIANVRFGMVKFHASGREDMDVRMLLPSHFADNDKEDEITGRPFVCEIIDAYHVPSASDLQEMVKEINCSSESLPSNRYYYGCNPMGVGISDKLAFCPASAYSKLQAETEEKVKYYGCYCWSENSLPDQKTLTKALSCFPLEIQQRTPLRVLHRRTNMVRLRHVLHCQVTRIDDHYFRMHISTSAGTYVKEFVHGDLGRTRPNVSTILRSKTDLLELDCEGIKSG